MPSHGAVDVPADSSVQVVFSDALDADLVRDDHFSLEGPSGPVAHTLTLDSELILLEPSQLLEAGQHELHVASGIWSEHDGALKAEVAVEFSVRSADMDTSDSGVQ